MIKTQIVIWKNKGANTFFYIAQYRRVYFLYRTKWRDIQPAYQDSYDKAEYQCKIIKDNL